MKKLTALLMTTTVALSSMSLTAVNSAAATDPFAGKNSVNIVYLGGSITQGAGVSDKSKCWVNRIGEYFKEAYPGKTINNYNAGLGGTGSDMGIMRLEKDVLSKKPDYVFVEFAVNDIGKTSAARHMESIVRSLQTLENVPYVTFVYTAKYDSSKQTVVNNSAAHQPVADYYNIPTIEMRDDLEDAILSTGTMEDTDNVKKWLVDLTHPTAEGYDVYYKAIKSALETGEYYKKPTIQAAKLDINSYPLSTKWVSAKEAKATGTWKENNHATYGVGYTSTTPGNTLEYTFSGPVFGIQHRIGKECGKYKLEIDGKNIGTIDTYYGSTTSQGVLGYQNFALGAGEHRVKITVLDEKNDKIADGTVTPVAIDYFISQSKPSAYKWINEGYEDCDFQNLVTSGNMTYDWSSEETANGSKGAMKVTAISGATGPNYRCETLKGVKYNVSAWIKVANIADWKINSNSDKVRFVFQPKVLNEDGSWGSSECFTECVVTDAGIISGDWVKVTAQYECDGKGKLAGQSDRVAASDISRVEIRLGSGQVAATTGDSTVPAIYYVDDFKVEPTNIKAASDYTVYSFEDGVRPGKLATADDTAEVVEGGVFGTKNALKVSNSTSSAAGWKLPISIKEGVTYNISYYVKALDETPLSMRPLIYIGSTAYSVKPNMTADTLTDVGDGWYKYATTYTATASGDGTIELRKLSAIAAIANVYLIDDVIVEPKVAAAGSNAVFEENFNSQTLGSFTKYIDATTTTFIEKSSGDYYVELGGANNNIGLKPKTSISLKGGVTYKLSFDAKAEEAIIGTTKCMWIFTDTNNANTYTCNTTADYNLTTDWKHYEWEITPAADTTYKTICSRLSNSMGSKGKYCLDNVKIEEVGAALPEVKAVEIIGKPVAGAELTAAITGDTAGYMYKVYTVDENGNGGIVANGTTLSGSVSYTPTFADSGKFVKFVVTAFDGDNTYNTIEARTDVAVAGTQLETKASARFTNTSWSLKLNGEINLSADKNGATFNYYIAVYDGDGVLIYCKPNSETLAPNTEKTIPVAFSVNRSAYSAKLMVWDANQKAYCAADEICDD